MPAAGRRPVQDEVERAQRGIVQRGDDVMSAQLAGFWYPGRAADLGGHRGARGAGELNGELAHAARRPGHQDVPAKHGTALAEGAQRGQARHRQCGGLLETDPVLQRRDGAGRHRDALGPALPLQVSDHPGAFGRAAAVGGLPDHDPGHVLTWAPAVGALLEQNGLAIVEAERAHFDDALVWSGLGFSEIFGKPQAARHGRVGDQFTHMTSEDQ